MKHLAPYAIICFALLVTGCKEDKDGFQGYAEGEYVYIASPIAGRLDTLSVHRGEKVEVGAALFALESENEAAAVREAQAKLDDLKTGKRSEEIDVLRAQLEQAIVSEKLSATQVARDEQQYKIGAISKADLDASRATHRKDKARVDELRSQLKTGELPARAEQIAAAEAALAQAKWKLDQKTVHAAKAGLIFDTLYVEGEWIQAGNPIISQLPPENIKVRFFIPQTELGKIKTGDEVKVHCDGCEADLTAKISYISPEAEYTPPVIYSNATREKLVFMVEARTSPDDAAKLHPGQPVEVKRYAAP